MKEQCNFLLEQIEFAEATGREGERMTDLKRMHIREPNGQLWVFSFKAESATDGRLIVQAHLRRSPARKREAG